MDKFLRLILAWEPKGGARLVDIVPIRRRDGATFGVHFDPAPGRPTRHATIRSVGDIDGPRFRPEAAYWHGLLDALAMPDSPETAEFEAKVG